VELYIVLYGGKLDESGWLNKDTLGRCDAALRMAHALPDAKIIFSVDEVIPNLRHTTLTYMRNMGWPAERMIVPEAAHDTWDETKSALRIVTADRACSVIVVSSWYHLPRIRTMWRYFGFKGTVVAKSSHETINPLRSIAHEIGAFALFFFDVLFQRT
jgi:uncharacterized SAM-binding protein YcdF (DUF218 family)